MAKALPIRRAAAALIGLLALAALNAGLFPPIVRAADDVMPEGNRSRGIKLFRQCQNCHSVRPEQHNSFGPNLHGVIGRRAGSVEGYPYSDALKNAGFEWTAERLYLYLKDPKAYLPGVRMLFKGLPDGQDRADVIAYIEAASKR